MGKRTHRVAKSSCNDPHITVNTGPGTPTAVAGLFAPDVDASVLSLGSSDLQQPLTVHCHSVQHTQGTTSTPSHSSVANETTEAEEQLQGDRTGPDGIEPEAPWE